MLYARVGGPAPPGRGPIFISPHPMGGIVIPADRLPRRYELVCADAASGFAAGLVYCIFGLILVILDINIIYLHPFG